ncbi:PiggyBac transposable element-derived protein 3, partial [Gonioctena quinquepunctata]
GSEDENLSDSDDYVPNPNTKDAVSSDEGDISVSDSEDEEPLSNVSARGKQKYTWIKVRGDQDNSLNPQFTSQDIEERPEMGRPIHYFEIFFSNQLLDLIVEQSNVYACQVDPNKPLNLTRSELRIFIGTIIYMSIFGLPRHRLYWSQTCRIPQVADSMSRKRWEEIKKTLHFNNNENLPNDRNDIHRDKLFKLRPFLDNLQQKNSNQVKPQMLCVDEQIVPFKGMSSQYL